MTWVMTFLRWITGDLAGHLRAAYELKLKAETDEKKLVAEAAIADIQRMIEDRKAAKEVRLATAGFWEMRLIAAIIAGCFTFHLVLVTLDTCFRLGWQIAKFPPPIDQWQGVAILFFFGAQPVQSFVGAIASAIRGRR